MLEHGLQKGLIIGRLTGNFDYPISLPECRNGNYLCNDMYSFRVHTEIVQKILQNFINRNLQYFRLKPGSQRYAGHILFSSGNGVSENNRELPDAGNTYKRSPE
jgi:hypothetical protein